jgi:molybdate transport system substrate-binding protein
VRGLARGTGALAPVVCSAFVALAACGGEAAGADAEAPVSVFAASSLTDAFGELAQSAELEVAPSFAGSQVLRLQIAQGAPADVFASADRRHMDALVEAGLVGDARVFAHNELVVVVPPDNPAGIEAFEDLPRARRIVVGDPNVPVGRYTRRLLVRAAERFGDGFVSAVRARVVSEESNVRLVRAKVELGEADAAIVYRTDAAASERVRVVPIPDALNVRAEYLIGVVSASERPERAARWIAHVEGDEGRRTLSAHGFVPAP